MSEINLTWAQTGSRANFHDSDDDFARLENITRFREKGSCLGG
jgi:hypothetical protein